MRLLWLLCGYYGLFRVIMGYSGLLWGFVAPVHMVSNKMRSLPSALIALKRQD